MFSLNKINRKLNTYFGEICARFSRKAKSKYKDIKFFAQLASVELIQKVYTKQISPAEDPNWRDTGAESIEEYIKWHDQMCGMACLQMILFHKLGQTPKIVALAKKCNEYGGYIEKEDDIDGLFYEPFCEFVRKEFGLKAIVAESLSLNRIKSELSKNRFVIVSVHPTIRDLENKTPERKGGHLVLLTGYNDLESKFYLNNPSGFTEESRKDYEISYEDFERFFAKRGIIVI